MSEQRAIISKEKVEKFLLLTPLLYSAYSEMTELSKKKPNDPLNKFKVEKINQILTPMKELLKGEPIIEFLDVLDDESLPSNSDAVLILRYFREGANAFETKHKTIVEINDLPSFSTKIKEWNIETE